MWDPNTSVLKKVLNITVYRKKCVRKCINRILKQVLFCLLSSAVSTPFTRIGRLVIVWSHFTSCTKLTKTTLNHWNLENFKSSVFFCFSNVSMHATYQSKTTNWVNKLVTWILLVTSFRGNMKLLCLNMWHTFQLRVRSIWPATYEASPESLA